MLNIVALMGRLTADPELRYTQSNIPVTSFCLAVDRRYSRAGEEKQTDFINIVAWRQSAEFVSKWFKKGQLVAVDGSIQTRKYQDKDGNNRTAVEVVANNVHFAESKRDSSASGGYGGGYGQPGPGSAPAPQAAPSYSNTDTGDFAELSGDDDLPF
ncbi:MAG: single-stranded DNA-binding protein [Clostridiales bacterium]|nr:single-stranded DNA-binding protein [Clostridiales bacterium]